MKTEIVAILLAATVLVQTPGLCEDKQSTKLAAAKSNATVFVGAKIIDGSGGPAIDNGTLIIEGDKINSISAGVAKIPAGAKVVSAKGTTIMPALVDGHTHLGLLKGESAKTGNQSVENDVRQLKKFAQYGIGALVSLGTDEDFIYSLRARQQKGEFSNCPLILTAGHGFGIKDGAPPLQGKIDDLAYRPENAEQARKDIDELATHHADVVKLWLDNLDGKSPAMPPAVYKAIIDEAHKKKLKVAAHISHLADAKALVNAGVDILAHSVRDGLVDDELIASMKAHNTYLVPTLVLDEVCFTFKDPAVLSKLKKSKFFIEALDDGILAFLESSRYQVKPEERKALDNGKKNLNALNKAGVNIAFGTDSGASPERIQGFCEHRELELMVQSGLTPLKAIQCATKNTATMLGVDDKVGTLAPGKLANFIVLNADPLKDISNTQKIQSVWLNGQKIPGSQHL